MEPVLARWTRRLGALGFGSASIGNLYQAMSDDDAARAVVAARGAGMRYFDTAPHYGLGLAEERLGTALQSWPEGSFVVSTKAGRLLDVDPDPPAGRRDTAAGFDVPATRRRRVDLSPGGIRSSLEQSLSRLGLSAVDILLLHDPEELAPPAEWTKALDALTDLRDEGVVGAVGVGSKDTQALHRAVETADLDLVMVAGRYTLLDQSAQHLLDTCRQRGIGAIAVGVFNSGLLASATPAVGDRFEYAPAPTQILQRARDIAAVCAEHDLSLPHVAVHFPRTHPAVVNVTVGLRDAVQVDAAAGWQQSPIPAALWSDLAQAGLITAGPR